MQNFTLTRILTFLDDVKKTVAARLDSETAAILALVAITLVGFAPVCWNDFTNYDDRDYVTRNAYVQSGVTGASAFWALTTTHSANWHPLTWLSLQLDHEMYGLQAWGYHLTNLLLHTANVILLFVVLRRMTGAVWPSAVAAAFFAVHPLHVESVAWVAERKDVLSTCLLMLTLWAYVKYVESPRLSRYVVVLLIFGLGLTAKPMLVTLPCVLLLLDFWPLRRFAFAEPKQNASIDLVAARSTHSVAKLLCEKLPFFALSAASCVLTLWAQKKAVIELEALPFDLRGLNALLAYAHYIGTMLWPRGLAAFYPHPGLHISLLNAGLAALLLAVITVCALRVRKTQPYLIVGWLWYLGTLVPVIGLLQVGAQAVADRYTYVPLIGLFIALVWGASRLFGSSRWGRCVLASATSVLLIICMIGTWKQTQVWRNGITLWQHACAVTKGNYLAHENLGAILLEQGKRAEADQHLEYALQIKPNYADAHHNLGVLCFQLGKQDEAVRHFVAALTIKPDDGETLYNLGMVLFKQGRLDEARKQFEAALVSQPELAAAHKYLGTLLVRQGQIEEGRKHFEAAIRLRADD